LDVLVASEGVPRFPKIQYILVRASTVEDRGFVLRFHRDLKELAVNGVSIGISNAMKPNGNNRVFKPTVLCLLHIKLAVFVTDAQKLNFISFAIQQDGTQIS
jgi:hypothetical protein